MSNFMRSMSIIMLVLGIVVSAFSAPAAIELYPIVDPTIQQDIPEHHGTVLDQHRIELNWSQGNTRDFSAFRVYYSTTPDVNPATGQTIEISEVLQTSTVVSGLNLATDYYFRLFGVNHSGELVSVSGEQLGRTMSNSYPFNDDIEGGLGGWDLIQTTWSTTTSLSHSATHSWTDSPDSNYTNSSSRTLVTSINLMTAQMPVLTYWQYYNIMVDGDRGYVEVSIDGGSNWERVCSVTGSSAGWLMERIDLTPYRGNVDLKIRWRLVTNTSGVSDGWYVDDVSIAETPYSTFNLPVYDNVNNEGHSDSLWFSSTWQRVPGGVGAGYYFKDSPYDSIAEYISTKLTSSNNINLGSAQHPWLVFYHRFNLAYQNQARVEVSIDGGVNWTVIQQWNGPLTISSWTQKVIDLSNYAGGPIRLRFHLKNLGSLAGDGWDIDNIHVTDAPYNVTLAIAANNCLSADLRWTSYSGGDFAKYDIYRSYTSTFLLESSLIASVTSSYDTTLNNPVAPDSTYYYQIYVVDSEGRYIGRSNVAQRTPYALTLLTYPYFDDLESGYANYLYENPWAVTTETAYSGTHSWSDSPYGNYGNSISKSLVIRIDLVGGGAVMPELSFQQMYGFETNADWGYVDISTDGTNYTPIYYVTGSSGVWLKERIDLTPWRGQQVYLRFRISTNSSGVEDGWHLDDIRIAETGTAPLTFPLVDSFNDSSYTHQLWISGAWGWTYPSDNGTHYWSNRSTGSRPDINNSAQTMVLGNTLNFSTAVYPQLRMRYRSYNSGSATYLQISQDNGANYSTLYTFPDVSSWSIAQVDLSGYVGGSPVRLRLYSYDTQYYGSPWFDVEDLTITERPPEVTLALAENQPYQARLTWRRFTDGDFAQYVVKRSSSAGVTISSTTMATITNAADTSWLQTGLSPYDVYYYKVFVYDTVGLNNTGSNEVQRTSHTVPMVTYPFSDDLESGGSSYLAELPWEITTEVAHSGTHSWSDSPLGNYANSTSPSFMMKIDLNGGGAVMPELTFWQQYGFETNADWGFISISTDGSSYSPIYYITGSSGTWLKERVDLTPWRGNIVWLRFQISTNSSSVADGWHIDDISINETATALVSYPLVDMFDDSTATHQLWISGAWGWTYPSDNGTHYWSNRSTGSRPDINSSAQTMVLGNTLNLSSAVHPQIRLRYRSYNNGSVTQLHISQDNGANYSNLYSFPDVSSWSIAQVDLSGYVGGSPVRLRLYSSDAQYYGTPWFDVEDLTITDRPPEVTLALTENQNYQARLSWSRFTDGDFARYEVKRGSSAGVTISSTTVATITNRTDTTWVQTGLSPYDVYYFKVFVYDTVGVYNNGSNEVQRPSKTVPMVTYPFSDNMEAGASNFLAELPWEITTEIAHSGTHSWSDSPLGNYSNSASYSLVMKIDLNGGGAAMPELTFWQQYGFETNADWGYVDISTDGSSFSPIYYITGSSGTWLKERIDLTPWRGYVIWLRFRVSTNSSSVADGWHIDDISINETTTAPVSYPLVDMFDDSSATHQLWISGAWGWTYPSDNGTHYWSNRSTGSRPDINGSAQHMVLGNTLDLSSAVHPQIRLRYRAYNNGSVTQLHISQDNGANYSNLYSFPDVSSWSIAQVDLSGYVGGSPVRLRLYSSDAQYYGTPWFDMEDLTITERPPEVTLALTDNQPYQARFRWSRFSDGDFSYYVVKRSSSSGVTLSSTTVATITDIADTSWLQTGLSPYDVYYYKVFVYDTVGVYNSGSNEAQRPSLSVPLLSYPFSNDMESGAGNFLAELPWEITSEVAYSGTHSWSDSPYGNYANSASYSLVMKIDLGGGGAVMPELTFWQQYGFETNADWGYVDVSTDGSSYSPIYYITGSSGNWLKERIDLTPWRGYVIWLRFRVSTNSSSVADGWHIDDIQINETTTAAISYPLVDTFNDSSYTHGLWISSAFNWTSPSDNGTHYWSNQATGSRPDINGTAQYMVMGNTMDLSTATYPQIRLRYRAYNNGSVTYLQISQDNGANYTTLYTFPSMSSWSNAQVDLSAYVGGSPMRLRLYSSDATYYGTPWFDVEDLAITENPTNMAQVNYCKIDQPAYVWLTVGQTSPQIFSRVYEPGITNGVGQGTGLLAQIGRGPDGTFPWNPAAGWTWATATYYGDVANDSMDQYFGTISGGAVGMYDYAFRYSINSGTYWNYADLNGNDIGGNGYNYYEPSQAGNLVVTLEPELTLSATQIELTLPEGQTASRVITIGNDGVGPLFFVAQESTTPPTPTDITWLEVSPASANINSNESRTLTVLINATNLTATNTYNAYVVLLTNDPAYTEVDIPITVHVVPPGSVALSGAVLNVNNQAPEQTVFIEVFSGGSLVTSATAGSDGFYYIFGVASGNYLVRVHSEGYYPEQDSTLIPATGVNFTVHRIPNIIPTSTSVHFYGASSYFNSAPLKVGDVVTAQDEDGIWCGCYTVQVPGHYGFLHVYGDDPLTPGVDEGATAGDNLTFRINGNYAHTLGPDTPVWTSDGDTRHVELSADLIRTDMLFLDASWNLISFNMMPDCTDIRIVLQPIISPSDSNVIRVSGFDMSWGGARTYDPRLPEFSDLWDMDPTHGYWLKTVHTDTLAVFGDHYWSDNPMPLDVGWNLSSYLPEETREVERALCSIEGLFAFVSGFDQGAQTYVPGSPFNDLDSLGNGFGYWIKMNYAGTLTYDPTGGCPGSVDGLNQSQPPLALDDPNSVRPTTRWDDYYGDITIAGQPLAVGEIIQAFDRYGNLCGEATIRIAGKYGFLHVYGDDPATSDVEGPTDNQPVQFMWHGQQLGVAWQNDQAWQGQRRTVRLDLNLDLTPTNTWCDFYSSNSMLQTIPVPLGSVIEAYDPQGVQCGRFVVHTAGYYGYLHVYGDDPTTPGIDEGAMPGDTITFSINNGTTIKSINPAWVTGQPGDFFQVNLYGSGYLLPVIDVVISIDQTDIHLDWSAPRYPVDRYVIYRGMNPDFSLTPADSIGYSTTEHYVDPSILETTPNAFYKIKVVGGQ